MDIVLIVPHSRHTRMKSVALSKLHFQVQYNGTMVGQLVSVLSSLTGIYCAVCSVNVMLRANRMTDEVVKLISETVSSSRHQELGERLSANHPSS